jgi:transglutaminase-like putative cysteine protease
VVKMFPNVVRGSAVTLMAAMICALAGGGAPQVDRHWMGLFVGETRIGYSWYEDRPREGGGKSVFSETVIRGRMLDDEISLRVASETELDAQGEVQRISSETESGGRTVAVVAARDGNRLIVDRNQGGARGRSEVALTEGVPFTQDPLEQLVVAGQAPEIGSRKVQSFDSNLLSMVVIEVVCEGETTIEPGAMKAYRIEIKDPRAPSTAYVSATGEVIRIEGPMGIVYRPETEAAARQIGEGSVELSNEGSVPLDRPLNQRMRGPLTLEIAGLRRELPSDGHQTVEKKGDVVQVTVHPVAPDFELLLSDARRGPEEWRKAEPRLPSDREDVRREATRIVGREGRVARAIEKLRLAVYQRMRVNAGIGVLREYDEIWESQEGVCRDHAIALATLVRAAGVPAKLVSGLVAVGDKFYYHAWVEYWDGEKWVGVDSTRPAPQLTSHHIKVAEGSVAQAYGAFLLEGARIRVIRETP